jgi:hypothetical protein
VSQPAPVLALSQYLDRWAKAHLGCAPADRPTAEAGVRLAYTAAGLPPPNRIVWCGGPLEIVRHLRESSALDNPGRNVKVEVFDRVRTQVGTLAEIFWKEIIIAAGESPHRQNVGAAVDGHEQAKAVAAAVNRLVHSAVFDDLSRISVRLRQAFSRLRGQSRLLPYWDFDEVAVGSHQLAALDVYEYLHDVLDCREQTQDLRGLWMIARSAGWLVPHAQVCWISERPNRLHTDVRGRLHCHDGPAISYPDGWCAHAWKGVQVPAWVIEHPETITLWSIANTFDPVVRNCMIEIMTPERFVRAGGASRVCEDETGVLWRKLWGHRGVTIGSWTAVEVVNGTPEQDGSRKHYFLRVPSRMRSAREAVAWTYGLSKEQYAGLLHRT